MKGYYHENFRLLSKVDPNGAEIIKRYGQEEMKVIPIKTKSGAITFQIEKDGRTVFLHSKYDPEKEARQFICSKKIKDGDTVVVYGFGLGYHIKESLNCIGENGRAFVIEPNVGLFKYALKYVNLNIFLSDKRLKIILENNLGAISKKLAGLMEEVQKKNGHLLVHRPSLEITPDYADFLKQLLLEWQVKQDTLIKFAGQLEENLIQNMDLIRRLPGAARILHTINNIPVLLVAAGPSLDKSIEYIRAIQDRCLVFSVGTALKPLLMHGITPDLVIITDPHPIVVKQIEGVSTKAPLIAFPTVHPAVLAEYPGLKLIACQQGVDAIEKMAEETGEELISTGGSVITAALDIAIRMGCNPVLFAGLDLGYVRGKTHAAGTMHEGLVIKDDLHLQEIPNNQKSTIKAPVNFNIFRKWIEDRIRKTGGEVKFFNMSAEGAVIKGAPYMTWDEIKDFLQADQKPVKELLYKICST
ncbi:MAG: motility associated factor glycosyltransferase family protein [Bacillota bacterium]